MHVPQPSRTVFVGDLSIYCTEEEVCQLFTPFGTIENMSLKRVQEGKNYYISYGFIKYQSRACAENAIAALNGVLFLGRPLRIGWAVELEERRTVRQSRRVQDRPAPPPRAQIHLSFHSTDEVAITEFLLRSIFERAVGEVIDVVIKKIQFNHETKEQSGYGFVHFPLTNTGVSAALRAVRMFNDKLVENIYFRCSISHGLSEYIRSFQRAEHQMQGNILGSSMNRLSPVPLNFPNQSSQQPTFHYIGGNNNNANMGNNGLNSAAHSRSGTNSPFLFHDVPAPPTTTSMWDSVPQGTTVNSMNELTFAGNSATTNLNETSRIHYPGTPSQFSFDSSMFGDRPFPSK